METLAKIAGTLAGMYVTAYAAQAWAQERKVKRNLRIATDLQTRQGLDAMRRLERKGRR